MLEFYWTNHSVSEDLDHKFSFVYFQQQSTNSDMKEKERENIFTTYSLSFAVLY